MSADRSCVSAKCGVCTLLAPVEGITSSDRQGLSAAPELATGSRLKSSIHISPTLVSMTIRKSRAIVVASHSARTILSTFGPAADGFQVLLEPAPGEDPPGGGCVLVLGEPSPAFPFGPRGNQVPEPQPHLAAIADGAFRVAVVLVSRDVSFEMQAVRRGDKMMGIAALLGRFGPDDFGLSKVVLAIQRQPGRAGSPSPP